MGASGVGADTEDGRSGRGFRDEAGEGGGRVLSRRSLCYPVDGLEAWAAGEVGLLEGALEGLFEDEADGFHCGAGLVLRGSSALSCFVFAYLSCCGGTIRSGFIGSSSWFLSSLGTQDSNVCRASLCMQAVDSAVQNLGCRRSSTVAWTTYTYLPYCQQVYREFILLDSIHRSILHVYYSELLLNSHRSGHRKLLVQRR